MPEKSKVISLDNFHTVIAVQKILKGEIILTLSGTLTDKPSKYSIQISTDKHLLPYSADPQDEKSTWRFLNHSCNPNCYVDIVELSLIATKDISMGEEVRFDYNNTEYEIASSFFCRCGSENCYGEIKGSHYLLKETKEELLPQLVLHLKIPA